MKKEFEELYSDLQGSHQDEFNNLWDKVQQDNSKKNRIFLIIAIIIFILIFPVLRLTFFAIIYFLAALLIVYVILSIIFSKHIIQFRHLFKEKIITILINNFYHEVDYIPKKQIPRTIYDEARYPESYNRYHSDDYFEGKLDDSYPLKMAEVHTVYESKDSDGDTTTTTRFHGLFAKIDLKKSINSNFIISSTFSSWGNKNKLEMDSQEFEKYFDIISTNKIISMQLLTHDIMELLIDFLKTTQIKFDISIYDTTMYIRFHTGSMFEFASMKKKSLDKKTLEHYYNILSFTYTLPKYIINIIEQTEI